MRQALLLLGRGRGNREGVNVTEEKQVQQDMEKSLISMTKQACLAPSGGKDDEECVECECECECGRYTKTQPDGETSSLFTSESLIQQRRFSFKTHIHQILSLSVFMSSIKFTTFNFKKQK